MTAKVLVTVNVAYPKNFIQELKDEAEDDRPLEKPSGGVARTGRVRTLYLPFSIGSQPMQRAPISSHLTERRMSKRGTQ